jgi:hypothetical protein
MKTQLKSRLQSSAQKIASLILLSFILSIAQLQAQNVGIGTLTPSTKLDVASSTTATAIRGISTVSQGTGVYGVCNLGTTAWGVYGESTTGFAGYFNGRVKIMSSFFGGLGVGKDPSYPIDATSNNTNYVGNFVNTQTSSNVTGLYASCYNTPDYGEGINGFGGSIGVSGTADLVGAGSRVGIDGYGWNGTNTNIGLRGDAKGGTSTFGVIAYATGASGANWAGWFVGNVFAVGTYSSSDRKLKNDIKPLTGALSIINQLKPSSYTFKTKEYKQLSLPEGLQYGLIADEVQQVVPGAVKKATQPATYENNDQHKGKKLTDEVEFNAVNYTEMIPILIGAVKEQQTIITDQNKKIDDLQKQIDELKVLIKNK